MRILIITLLAIIFSTSGKNTHALNTVLTQKKCSGMIYDLNCYQDILQKAGHSESRYWDFRPTSVPVKTNGTVIQGTKIIIDTEDLESCEALRDNLLERGLSKAPRSEDLINLCSRGSVEPTERYKSITLMWEAEPSVVTPLKDSFFKSSENNVTNNTRNLVYMMAGVMGVLWFAPESVTKWNKDEIKGKGFFSKWKENVSHGPVMDKDDPLINYVGHPISGAIYYNLARNQGSSIMESFGYSVLMSTFFWEYGIEALAEKPSIQDLILTPVIGSVLGEMFYRYAKKIEANDGKVLGSKKMGKVVLFLLNPAGKISENINSLLSSKVVQDSRTNLILSRRRGYDSFQPASNYIGIQLDFKFY